MSVIEKNIVLEDDNSISFGNYLVTEKQKVENFDVDGDIYKVRTHTEVTRLSKNSKLLLETVPGATVHKLLVNDKQTTFTIEGKGGTQITLELEPETHYTIYVDDVNLGKIKTNISGKISFSIDLTSESQAVKIEKHYN